MGVVAVLWTDRTNGERLRIALLVCWQLAIVLWAAGYPLAIQHRMPHSQCSYHNPYQNGTHAGWTCLPTMAIYGLGLGAQLSTLPVYASFTQWIERYVSVHADGSRAWTLAMMAVSWHLAWLGAFLSMFIVMMVDRVGPTAVLAVTTTLMVLLLLTSAASTAEYALRDCLMAQSCSDELDGADWRDLAMAFVDDPPLAYQVNRAVRARSEGADSLGVPI